jgi:hypothetical protein
MAATKEPIARHLRRALLWIKLANDGGVHPTARQLDQYAVVEEPSPAQYGGKLMQAANFMLGPLTDAQPVADYLLRVG